jgi:dTMP kinase
VTILPNFIVFEGGDGSGRTTQLQLIAEYHTTKKLWITAEPTDSPLGCFIRELLHSELTVQPETLAMLFAADRHEHLYAPNGIIERCSRGETVICDRYILSSLVYQGLTCGESLPVSLNKNFPLPSLIVFFDIDPAQALARIGNRLVKDSYEQYAFQTQIRERYRRLLPHYAKKGCCITTVNAAETVEEVQKTVQKLLNHASI